LNPHLRVGDECATGGEIMEGLIRALIIALRQRYTLRARLRLGPYYDQLGHYVRATDARSALVRWAVETAFLAALDRSFARGLGIAGISNATLARCAQNPQGIDPDRVEIAIEFSYAGNRQETLFTVATHEIVQGRHHVTAEVSLQYGPNPQLTAVGLWQVRRPGSVEIGTPPSNSNAPTPPAPPGRARRAPANMLHPAARHAGGRH
jgi:hypothetical protein